MMVVPRPPVETDNYLPPITVTGHKTLDTAQDLRSDFKRGKARANNLGKRNWTIIHLNLVQAKSNHLSSWNVYVMVESDTLFVR